MLACKELVNNEYIYQRGLEEPEDVPLDDFWELWKTNGLVEAGEKITAKDRYIDLYRSLWFILGILMWQKHRIVINEHIYYVINDIQKPFNMVSLIILNTCAICLKWLRYSLLLVEKTRSTTNPHGTPVTCPTRRIISTSKSRKAFQHWCRNISGRILVVTIVPLPTQRMDWYDWDLIGQIL